MPRPSGMDTSLTDFALLEAFGKSGYMVEGAALT